ncbi:MAG: hypothetical protein JWP35_631 [Caulobacter sp.]|nr:hypothetical protein [Caulobacter sp.]
MSATAAWAAPGPMPPAPIPAPDQAVIYIYRPPAFTEAVRGFGFSIDDVRVVTLGNGGCTVMLAPAGDHLFGMISPMDIFSHTTKAQVHWDSGATYYYRLGVSSSVRFRQMTFSSGVDVVGADEAAGALSSCRFTPAKPLGAAPAH